MFKKHKAPMQDAELDITSFMNLMIVLVPVLLLSLVFNQVRVLNLQLPAHSAKALAQEQAQIPQTLELAVYADQLVLNYPAGQPLRAFAHQQGQADLAALSSFLQELKRTFMQANVEKKAITLLLPADLSYQQVIALMDTVRSFKTVVVTDVVDAELFPDIALADLPSGAAPRVVGERPVSTLPLQAAAGQGTTPTSTESKSVSAASVGAAP